MSRAIVPVAPWAKSFYFALLISRSFLFCFCGTVVLTLALAETSYMQPKHKSKPTSFPPLSLHLILLLNISRSDKISYQELTGSLGLFLSSCQKGAVLKLPASFFPYFECCI